MIRSYADLSFAELRLYGVDYAVPILVAITVLLSQRYKAEQVLKQPLITRFIILIYNDCRSSSS
jgi:hypothetical protein